MGHYEANFKAVMRGADFLSKFGLSFRYVNAKTHEFLECHNEHNLVQSDSIPYCAEVQLCVRLKKKPKKQVSANFLAAVSAKCTRGCQRNVLFLQQSSVCRAGLHAGVINNDGGWLDVTRQGRKDFFIRSNKNGVESLG